MAFRAKFTGARGKVAPADIAIGAGDAESSADVISINLDIGTMSKGEALLLIDSIRDAVHNADWPSVS